MERSFDGCRTIILTYNISGELLQFQKDMNEAGKPCFILSLTYTGCSSDLFGSIYDVFLHHENDHKNIYGFTLLDTYHDTCAFYSNGNASVANDIGASIVRVSKEYPLLSNNVYVVTVNDITGQQIQITDVFSECGKIGCRHVYNPDTGKCFVSDYFDNNGRSVITESYSYSLIEADHNGKHFVFTNKTEFVLWALKKYVMPGDRVIVNWSVRTKEYAAKIDGTEAYLILSDVKKQDILALDDILRKDDPEKNIITYGNTAILNMSECIKNRCINIQHVGRTHRNVLSNTRLQDCYVSMPFTKISMLLNLASAKPDMRFHIAIDTASLENVYTIIAFHDNIIIHRIDSCQSYNAAVKKALSVCGIVIDVDDKMHDIVNMLTETDHVIYKIGGRSYNYCDLYYKMISATDEKAVINMIAGELDRLVQEPDVVLHEYDMLCNFAETDACKKILNQMTYRYPISSASLLSDLDMK